MKWKPPEENSVDFTLRLRFPPVGPGSDEVDFTARPMFLLYEWQGGDREEYFDEMEVTDEEWEE
jgi:mRNA guanylyltransferase